MESVDLRPGRDVHLDAPSVTALDAIAEELGEVVSGEVTFPVDARPNYKVVYSKALDGPRMAAMRRSCKDESQPSGTNEYQWAKAVLAAQCVAIVRNGQRIVDSGGGLVTFRSPELWGPLKVPAGSPSGATLAVKKFYGSDGAASNTFQALLVAAGWASDVMPDPTEEPPTGS